MSVAKLIIMDCMLKLLGIKLPPSNTPPYGRKHAGNEINPKAQTTLTAKEGRYSTETSSMAEENTTSNVVINHSTCSDDVTVLDASTSTNAPEFDFKCPHCSRPIEERLQEAKEMLETSIKQERRSDARLQRELRLLTNLQQELRETLRHIRRTNEHIVAVCKDQEDVRNNLVTAAKADVEHPNQALKGPEADVESCEKELKKTLPKYVETYTAIRSQRDAATLLHKLEKQRDAMDKMERLVRYKAATMRRHDKSNPRKAAAHVGHTKKEKESNTDKKSNKARRVSKRRAGTPNIPTAGGLIASVLAAAETRNENRIPQRIIETDV